MHALLDNGMLDVIYLTGTPGQHVRLRMCMYINSCVHLDDVDVINLTGMPGQQVGMHMHMTITAIARTQVKRVLKDFMRKGWAGTRSVPCLLRVPWLEI